MLETLIEYFVCGTKGHITKTQLVKFLYLADLYAVKWTGQQLTTLDWYYYRHGPWHEDIDAALERMNGSKLTLENDGQTCFIRSSPNETKIEDLKLSTGLQLMLENIRREWAGSGDRINKLLEYVYSTAPMAAVKETYSPEDKVRLDLQKEREKLIEELDA